MGNILQNILWGYDERGFDKSGYHHVTGTRLDTKGRCRLGYFYSPGELQQNHYHHCRPVEQSVLCSVVDGLKAWTRLAMQLGHQRLC